MLFYFLWLLFGVFSIYWAEDHTRSFKRVLDLFEGFLFIVIFINIIDSEKKLDGVINIFYISTIVVSMYLIFSGKLFIHERVIIAEGQNPNWYGRAISMGFLIGLFYVLSVKRFSMKIVHLVCLTILLAIIIKTMSRGIWSTLLLAIVFTYLFKNISMLRQKKNIFIILIVGLCTTLLFASLITQSSKKRLYKTFTIDQKDTFGTGRIHVWRIAFEMFKDQPLIGVGINNFFNNFPDYIPYELIGKRGVRLEGTDPHNFYIGVLCELGIVGFSILMLFIFFLFKRLKKIENCKYRTLNYSLFIFMFFSGFFHTLQYRKFFYLTIALFLAASIIYRNTREKK
jgi:O-antigen ligase